MLHQQPLYIKLRYEPNLIKAGHWSFVWMRLLLIGFSLHI